MFSFGTAKHTLLSISLTEFWRIKCVKEYQAYRVIKDIVPLFPRNVNAECVRAENMDFPRFHAVECVKRG